ncbi:YIP1 family protein [Methanogenium sp. S4BF]|uniref:YIP1 family protein n=1 Tax=Methanogenium sp. S4BF TaxID=1789226 RepID=UPI00241718BF|nr:YIP1 family protein [Methanogenium sp. S4BF]WFN34194.1 YIP1 family protein [Methanogenium sp. S4BF]
MGIMMNIADLLLRPAAFFSGHLEGDKPDMKMPLAIVLLSGIVGAISAAYVSSVTMAMMPSEVSEMGTMLLGIGAVAAFIGALIFWVIIAAVFHGISALRGGKGDFQRTLAVAGYGSLPMVFGSIISSIIIYFSLSGATIRPVSDPMQISAAVTDLMSGPSMMMAGVISLVFVLWSANIWVFGMQQARGLSGKDALITVGIPVIIYCLITFLPYIG